VLKVLVTGGAGFIGSELASLIGQSTNLTILDSLCLQTHPESRFAENLLQTAQCVHADVRDATAYKELVSGMDVVIHLAADTGTGQSMYEVSRYVSANAVGTAKLLESISTASKPPMRVILASSRAVYGDGVYQKEGKLRAVRRDIDRLGRGAWEPVDDHGGVVHPLPMSEEHPVNPTSIYGMTKLWQEQMVMTICEARRIDYVILRFQNVFGPGQTDYNPYAGLVSMITRLVAANEVVEVFEDGCATRDFVFIADAVAAIEAVMLEEGRLATTFNVGTGRSITLLALIEKIGMFLGKTPRIRMRGRFRVGDVRHAVADTARLRSRFPALSVTPIDEGIARYVEWIMRHPRSRGKSVASSLSEMSSRGLLLTAEGAEFRSNSERGLGS
jgi:dTDP-L-rhamnose 4-epimerase